MFELRDCVFCLALEKTVFWQSSRKPGQYEIYFLLIIMKRAFFPITGMLLTLDNINPLFSLCTLSVSCCFLFFLDHFIQNLCIASLLCICLLAFSHWYRYRVPRYCFSLFSNSTFPVISFVLFQCFSFFVSHYSSFSHQFYLPVFFLFAYFLLW